MNRLRQITGLGILAITISLLTVFSLTTTSDEVSAAAVNQQVNDEKERLLNGIRDGQMLYITSSSYDPTLPETASGLAWVGPQHTTGEVWMAVDSNGAYTTLVSVARDLNGKAIATMELENGSLVSTWIDTGETLVVTVPLDVCLGEWLEYVWTGPPELTDSAVQKESGELDGKTTVIFEETETLELPGEDAQSLVHRSEFVVESPLLFQISTYELDTDGARTLTYTDRFVSYALLPADTQIPLD